MHNIHIESRSQYHNIQRALTLTQKWCEENYTNNDEKGNKERKLKGSRKKSNFNRDD